MGRTNSSHVIVVVSALVCGVALLLVQIRPGKKTNSLSLLQALAKGEFAWGSSTTEVPISTVSVYAKSLLSRDADGVPDALRSMIPDGDSLQLQPVRDRLNEERLERVRRLCARENCDVNEVDKRFGLTPLHLAMAQGDDRLAKFLFDAGAHPVMDHVGRLPFNLSFSAFIHNAKNAKLPDSDCDFPTVDFGAHTDLSTARAEARRLISEGEPVLLRGAYTQYQTPGTPEWDVEEWVRRFSDTEVTVGSVPYARAFNLSTSRMTLSEYYNRFVRDEEADNVYVFNKNRQVTADGYGVLSRLFEDVFPRDSLFVHPDQTGHLDGVHFFFGRAGSGAPFHIHADAVNAAVHGRKKWFVYTPARTIYSRKTALLWTQEDLPLLDEDERPLECVQHPGDVVYVPLDWGHAVLNMDENTFGVALELLNKRDTLAHLTGHA